MPNLDRSNAIGATLTRGAYILSESEGAIPQVLLIGTGSEVGLCMSAQTRLKSYGIQARVASIPSWELFTAQDHSYRESVLPTAITARVTGEAASTFGWMRWAGSEGISIGIEHYGASAPGDEVMRQFGLTVDHVTSAALLVLGRTAEANREYVRRTILR